MINNKTTYQVYVGSELKSYSSSKGNETKEYWRLSTENPDKAVCFAKTEIIATNAMADTAINQQTTI